MSRSDAILVMGGAGAMGERATKELLSGGRSVTVADFRIEVAKQKVEAWNKQYPGQAEAVFVDVNDTTSLEQLLSAHKVAISAVGPFYRYARQVITAAIRSGTNIVDICDDDDALVSVLALDGWARQRGVIVVTGVGWTPGISNMLALKAFREVDAAKNVDITWVGSTSDSEGLAVIKHVLHAVRRDTPMFLSGRWEMVPALSGVKKVVFPDPIGPVNAFYCGHPEPLSLPMYLDGVDNVHLRGYLLPHEMQSIIKALLALELVNSDKKASALSEALQPALPLFSMIGERPPLPLSAVRVDVSNNAGDKKSYAVVDSMDRLTGIPPAIVAMMLADGKMTTPGVLPPEACLEPDAFLAELAKREIEVEEMSE